METRQYAVGDTGSVSGRGLLQVVNGKLEPPDNIIMTPVAARTYYQSFRQSHLERVKLMEAIEGLIAGNPPYDPQKLKAAGLAHIANVNTLDAKAMYEQVALTFWNLVNQTENYVVFHIDKMNDLGMDHDYSGWAEILARNWTKAIKKKWRGFVKQMNILTGQLVKFGVSPMVWSDERDCRWKTVDLSMFFCANQTSVDTDEWDCVCMETSFTIQKLYAIYLETEGKEDSPWNRDALEQFLIRKANTNNKGMNSTAFTNMLEMQRAIQNKSFNFASSFSDTVKLVSLLYREFSGKISHYIFDPTGEAGEEFLFQISDQYENFEEAVVVFTYNPGENYIHSNRGVGHKIFASCQITMQVDNSVVDMAKMASTIIVKSNALAGRNTDPIRFTSGVATDIGTAEFEQNNLGANIPGLIQVAQYFTEKVHRNSIIGGDDPGQPDQDRGSKSAPEVQMQSIKEFGIGKQSVAHFYGILDIVIEQMTIKMIHAKKSYPCYDIVEYWKEMCIREGVPEEVFSVPKGTSKNEMPAHLSVRAARVAGDGSNLGLIMGLNGVSGIAGGFGQKGQYNYRKDLITSRLGVDYVDRYLADSAEPDEAGSGASVAFLENLAMKAAEMPFATKDNSHKTHIGSHFALINQIMKKVEAQETDPVAADKIFSVAIPHVSEHFQFLSQDILNKSFIEQMKSSWDQIQKYALLNRVKAHKMMQAEIRSRAQEEQKMSVEMMEQTRKDQVAEREQQRKDFESQKKMERSKEQSDNRAEIMKESVRAKAENEKLAVQLKADNERADVVRQPKEILADRSTAELQETLRNSIGSTPNPADFK